MTEAGASPGPNASTGRAGIPAGPVLVVGYGNPLRSDDGVGPAVVDRLAGDARLAGVDLRAEHQLTPELAFDASRASLLVLVDAGAGEAPGEISVRRIEAPGADGYPVGAGAAGKPGAWTHHLDPEGLVGLAWTLWGAAPPVVLVSIGPASLEVGESLSDEVLTAVARAAELVATIIVEHRRA
jgi:hydrogenase maturation protease